MRAVLIVCAAFAAIGCLELSAIAGNDKQLQSVKGNVAFQKGANGAAKPLAVSATIGLADKDYAITGLESLAAVGLPDSSRVLVGSQSKIQLGFFNQAEGSNARFIVYNGTVRFVVEHPAGAKANYTFQTPTATIGVRGTEGDIGVDTADNTLRVNVYEQCDPNAPVVVTTKDGKATAVPAGKSLVVEVVNGVVREHIESLTAQLIAQFSPDFGVPSSWDAATGQVRDYATGQAAAVVNGATGGYGGEVVSQLGNLFGKKKATPSPAPTAESCSH